MISLPLVAHLFRQITRPRRMLGLVALASVPGLVAWPTLSQADRGEGDVIFIDIISGVSGGTISIAVLVVAVAVMRDERDGGTLPFIFLTPINRWAFAVSAWLAGAAAACLIVTAGWVVTLLAVGTTVGDWSAALPVLPTYLIAALAYSSVFVPIGFFTSRAVLVGLGYIFVWEGILATFIAGLSSSSMWRLAMSVLGDLVELSRDASDILGNVTPGVGGAAAKVAVVIALSVTVLAWAIRSRDAI